MNENNKILQICSYYLGTKLYQNLFDALEKFGIKEDIYVFIDKGYEAKEVYPSNIFISQCYNKIDRFIFHLKHTIVLNDINNRTKACKYDLIHAHSMFSNGYIAYKLNRKYETPYIVAVRNTDVNLFFEKMIHLRAMGVNILRNAKKVVFISNPYKNYTIEKFVPEKYKKEIEDKSVVIPNGIDVFWLENKFERKTIRTINKIRIVYAGSIDSNKNMETTAKACKYLMQQGYEVSYKIIGKIIDKRYNDFINKYSFIEYIPYCQKEDLINHYRDSDIFVMPSKQETFGLVYAEAMSQGLPILYTRGQGFDGQFEEGLVGYSVQYDSADEIAFRVKNILDNYEFFSTNCINKVDKFNWDKIAKEYLEIYKSIKL